MKGRRNWHTPAGNGRRSRGGRAAGRQQPEASAPGTEDLSQRPEPRQVLRPAWRFLNPGALLLTYFCTQAEAAGCWQGCRSWCHDSHVLPTLQPWHQPAAVPRDVRSSRTGVGAHAGEEMEQGRN